MIRIVRRGAAVALLATLAMPPLLWAHAKLVRSDPPENSRLGVAPTVLRLWFSEAPEVKLSSITLRDSAGAFVRLGDVRRGDTSVAIEAAILDTLKAGRYSVAWRVAGSDGHPISGSFSFTSAAAVVAADTNTRVETNPSQVDENPAESFGNVVARAVGFAAILVTIGAAAFRLLVLPRFVVGETVRVGVAHRLATAGAISAVVALIAAALRLGLQWKMLNGDPAAAQVHLSAMTMETQWGTAWLSQAVALVVAAAAFMIARRGSSAAWMVAALAAVVLSFTPALAGHAGANADFKVGSIIADGLHVLGASTWIGTLFCMLALAFPVVVSRSEEGLPAVAAMVNAFSPVALGAAGLVLLTGLFSAWLRLGALGPLWTTGYGRVLVIKLALVAGVAGIGAYNWRRVRPGLGTVEATARLRTSALAELGVGLAIVIVTAVLVALPTPVVPIH